MSFWPNRVHIVEFRGIWGIFRLHSLPAQSLNGSNISDSSDSSAHPGLVRCTPSILLRPRAMHHPSEQHHAKSHSYDSYDCHSCDSWFFQQSVTNNHAAIACDCQNMISTSDVFSRVEKDERSCSTVFNLPCDPEALRHISRCVQAWSMIQAHAKALKCECMWALRKNPLSLSPSPSILGVNCLAALGSGFRIMQGISTACR